VSTAWFTFSGIRKREAARLARLARAERFDRWARWVVFTVFLLLAFAASLSAQEPQGVLYVNRIEPTPAMAAMYKDVESCLHQRGNFHKVTWQVVAHPWESERGKTWGMWRSGRFGWNTITAVQADTAILRHEMVHDILNRNGFHANRSGADSLDNSPEHPAPPFGKCAQRFFENDYKPWGRQ
jgi:hypothetical protein